MEFMEHSKILYLRYDQMANQLKGNYYVFNGKIS